MSLAAYGGVPLVQLRRRPRPARCWPRRCRRWSVPGGAPRRRRRTATAGGARPAVRAAALAVAAVLAVPLVGGLAWLPLPGRVAHRGRPDADRRGRSRATCRAPGWTSTPSAAPSSTTTCSRRSSSPPPSTTAGRRSPTSSSGRRTAPTSTPTSTRTPPAQIDRAARGDRRRRSWSARSSTGPGGRSSATPRSSGTPRRARRHLRQAPPGARSASTSRPARSSGSSAPRSTGSAGTSSRGDEVGRPRRRRRPARRPHLLRGGLRRPGARRRRRRRRDARRPDQQRDVRLHRRERAAAGDEPAARRRVRPHGRRGGHQRHLRDRRARRLGRPLVGAVHPGGLRRGDRPARTPRRSPCGSASAPEWVLTALGARRAGRPSLGPALRPARGRAGGDDRRVLVIVPTYNEVDNLERILERLQASVPEAHALVVDDGSPDGTGELAEKLAAARRRGCTCCTARASRPRRRPTWPASAGRSSTATTSSSRWTPTARTPPSSCPGCWPRWRTPTSCSARATSRAAR